MNIFVSATLNMFGIILDSEWKSHRVYSTFVEIAKLSSGYALLINSLCSTLDQLCDSSFTAHSYWCCWFINFSSYQDWTC